MILCDNYLLNGCAIAGDLNTDNKVDLADFAIIADQFLQRVDPQKNWPMRQRDMHHTGRANFTVPDARLNSSFFDNILWQKPSPSSPDQGNFSSTSMVFHDNVGLDAKNIVLGAYHWPKGLQAMDRHTGQLLWFGNPDGGENIARMTPAFSNDGNTVYVVNDATNHPLMAFDAATGPATRYHNGDDPEPDQLALSSPTIGPQGRIWLHRWNDRVYAGTDYTTFISQTWAAASPTFPCFNDPSLYQNGQQLLVIAGGRTVDIVAWDAASASEVWRTSTPGLPTDATATIDPLNGNIYIPYGFDDIAVVGLNKDGQDLWDHTAMPVFQWIPENNEPQRAIAPGCISYDGHTFYFQTNSEAAQGALYAINTADGSVKWSYPTQCQGWEIHSSSPIVTKNDVVIVGNNLGRTYYAIHDNGATPLLLDTLTVDTNGNAQASPTMSPDGILYLPLRTTWTATNGDGQTPSNDIQNVFTAFDLK